MMSCNQSDDEVVSPVAVLQHQRYPSLLSQLPTELLIYTLRLALPYVDCILSNAALSSRFYVRMLYSIRRVAKRWQEIIDETPSFWTVILSTLPPHVNNTAILRSCNLPLFVVYEFAWASGHQHAQVFLGAIAHTRSRWSAISLETCDSACMREFFTTPAPLLHTFAISIQISWDDDLVDNPPELLGGQTSNLRYVDITRGPIRWKMGMFIQLNALFLSHIVDSGLTTSHILDFLRASPRLEYLHIRGAGVTPVAPSSSPIITLPYLKSIDLRSDSSIATDSILRHIQTPSCSTFVVDVGNGDGFDPIPFINETLNPFQETLKELHVRNGTSNLSIDSDGVRWQSSSHPDREYGFLVSIRSFVDPFVIRWVGQILQKEPGLQITFSHRATLSQTVVETLASMQCVTKVRVGGHTEMAVRRIVHLLSRPLSPSCSLPSLPGLRELLISSMGCSAEDLLHMAQFRSSAFSRNPIDRPNLTIKVWRDALKWPDSTKPIFNLTAVSEIRRVEGVESLQFVGPQGENGTLAIIWSEEVSEPTWG